MTSNLPSTNFYTLSELDFNLRQQVVEFNKALLDQLNTKTLSEIKNAFSRAIKVWPNGVCFIHVTELKFLLRTGNSGAHNIMWQHGISGYVSPSVPQMIDGDYHISGPDFCGLLEARILASTGKLNLYLRYVKALYGMIAHSSLMGDLRTSFIGEIDKQRVQLKNLRITTYAITHCEFSGTSFSDASVVQFAHVESVVTAPLHALNINNGVIILRALHSELTALQIHDFAGMYDYCESRGYSTLWADNYTL